MGVTSTTRELSSGWTFKRTDEEDGDWKHVQRVPTVVHLDLMDNGLNSLMHSRPAVSQIHFSTATSWTSNVPNDASVYLIFEGLDTFASVRLNKTVILESENMFLSHRVNITRFLTRDAPNELVIDFDSALLRGRALEKEHSEHRFIAHNGESGRVAVRKAQYHWGWDWGPVLMTAGPWRPVRLQICSAHIEDVWIKYDVHQDLEKVTGTVHVHVQGECNRARLSIRLSSGQTVFSQTVDDLASQASFSIDFSLDHPELWYPAGYGQQALYSVTVEVLEGDTTLDDWTRKTGFRRNELVQKEDRHGVSFYFRINNIDVFCGGSCWIPSDNFIPRISPARYRQWLQLMVDGNQIMTRVWGGGIYEEDCFYDTCDELGILVWQDFMFACGSYPAWPALLESVAEEAKQAVHRLRHHPSVILYAGNNEDYQFQEGYNLDYDYSNKNPDSWLKGSFPARYIYEHLLPSIVSGESHGVPYWPGSPFSNGKHSADPKVGDIHQWDVWHGTQEHYQTFDRIGGRFNSEFGMEAFPAMSTIRDFVTNPSELASHSRTLDFHNKADGHARRIALYLADNFPAMTGLESHVYITQLLQSEAITFAYRGWRRQWGDGRRCGGALVWQLNDCWPGTSWAIVDNFLRKKPAFYTISRTMQPLAIGVQRDYSDVTVCHARPSQSSPYALWVTNSLMKDAYAKVELRFVSVATGQDIRAPVVKDGCVLVANGTTEILSGTIANTREEPCVLTARLLVNDKCISRDADWPQPLKYLSFAKRGVLIDASEPGRYKVTVERPTKRLMFDERDGVEPSDNCIDVVPGDPQTIEYKGLETDMRAGVPKYRYLGSDEHQ
ncbi:hypothetical protein FE257_007420 [Aspergillus nanangensis]|uniref:Beta-mannosidase B n=1 Tax=Aspergillus nanangensis TaxID=2582783 RepID=A0AAD4CMQ3_ASPNN|nr:hypothetical protein FE257_007420 [Aspergillus nanangensis]